MIKTRDVSPVPTGQPFVLILGMHRSGTSCLAGALERCGLHLGDVRRTGKYNKKGYFESRELVALHDAILAADNAAWDRPSATITIAPEHRLSLARFAALLGADRPCGVKDPRIMLLLDDWLDLAPEPVSCIGTFRHPVAVASSLKHRNGMPIARGLALWEEYNQRLIAHHRRAPFPLIRYDLSSPDRYRRAIKDIASGLGLRPSPWEIWRFVSKKLDHQQTAVGAEMPQSCARLYNYLCQNCLNPSEKAAA